MNKVHTRLRIFLLLFGIIIFSLYSVTALFESKVNEDLVNYQFLSKQVQILLYEVTDGCSLSQVDHTDHFIHMINEMDLAYYVFRASPVFSFYSSLDMEFQHSVNILDKQWNLFYKLFNDEGYYNLEQMINSLTASDTEFQSLGTTIKILNKRWEIVHFVILLITIIYFLFLLIFLYTISKFANNSSGKSLDIVRNALIQGQEQERLRISLELHDKVAQDLFACRMMIDDIAATAENKATINSFSNSIALLDSSIKEVRDLSYSLRPPALQSIGLDSAIKSYIDSFSKKIDIPITFKAIGISNKNIDETVSINLYRILQETLNNTAKHAHADVIDVKLLYTYPYLLLKIDDNGVGFRYSRSEMKAKGRNKLGLPGINERVSLIGGELIINTEKGEGTKILIKVPLEDNDKL